VDAAAPSNVRHAQSASASMRILMICEAFLSIGGVPELVDNLAREFARSGHDVAIVCKPARGPLARRSPGANVEIACIDIPPQKVLSWRHPERLFHRGRAPELIEFMRRWRPDIINLQGGLRNRYPAVMDACDEIGGPVVVSLHDYLDAGVTPEYAPKVIERADAVTFLSAATQRSFQQFADAARLGEVIIGGVDCGAADAAAACERPRPYLFCAARLELKHKAIDALVRGFGMVAGGNPGIDLVLSGDGSSRGEIENIIAAEGLAARVELTGAIPRGRLWSLYKGALLFAMPSRKPEGLGLAFLEAMACGKPVIGTRSGGTPEIVLEGKTGLLVDHNEPGEIAAAIGAMLENPGLRESMGREARELAASNYSWPVVASRYLGVFRRAGSRPRERTLPARVKIKSFMHRKIQSQEK
jgi:glycosyltransferase involved in cell wall biosynthesis